MRRHLFVPLPLLGTSLAVTQEWDVPEEEKSRPNPIEETPNAIEEGKACFKSSA